jgi:hypothetical protein
MALNQDTINRKGIQKHNKQIGQGSTCDISVEADKLFHTSKIFGVHPCVYHSCTSTNHQILMLQKQLKTLIYHFIFISTRFSNSLNKIGHIIKIDQL